MSVFVHRSKLAASAAEAFQWHSNPGAFERLNPPWDPVTVVRRSGGLENGSTVELKIGAGPFSMKWLARHTNVVQGAQFQDVQEKGPFAKWEHTHTFVPEGDYACVLEDRVEYELPFGVLGRALGKGMIVNRLNHLFDYRHQVTQMDLESNAATATHAPVRALNIVVTGASGLVGSALVPLLTTAGHRVSRLVRSGSKPNANDIAWDMEAGTIDAARLEGVDAVIHLAGENIAGRWSAEKKRKILESRVKGTTLLSETLAKLKRPPLALISASAIGYYGDTGSTIVDESSPKGPKFLADVCKEWEASTAAAERAGIRVVHARLGVVLSPAGGALAKMLTPFKMGVGGVVGSGEQYWSWVSIEDVIGALHFAAVNDEINGAMNVVAPRAVTNHEFTKTLGKVLGRPTIFPMPAFAARLALGEMAEELLLTSTRVTPKKLLEHNYRFRFPELEDALRHLLGKRVPVEK